MMNKRTSPFLIGLTGMYCSGKNRVAALLEKQGFPVLDVDKLGHRAIETQREAILARFGKAVLGPGGNIDRRKLGEMVFGKAAELAALEAIVHPEANRLTEEWIKAQTGEFCVINAALLHRSSVFERLDALILVKAPLLSRFFRARRRDKLSWGELFRRFRSQKGFLSPYIKKSIVPVPKSGILELPQGSILKADIYIVDNRGYWGRSSQKKLEYRIEKIAAALRGGRPFDSFRRGDY
ncbi:MAG: dephospho-CoA kinase [Treponema sp.]|jgi:dephospho-CoA kinase|nr:dephospho-CoA kinase [Treponema sp.]